MAGPFETEVTQKKGPSSDHLSPKRISRTSGSYWRNRLVNTVSASGVENPKYSVRISYRRRKVRFALETANKDTAASKAARIFSFLIENGWEDTIAKYKDHPDEVPSSPGEDRDTVGALIKVASKHSTARGRSKQAYVSALRRIVAGVLEVSRDMQYRTRKKCGLEAWREQIDAVKLSELSPARIQAWKSQYLREAASEPGGDRNAKTTVNSLIRNAKALLSRKVLPFLADELALPQPLPFNGITMERQASHRYHSRIDARDLLNKANKSLRTENPEAYKIFLLALVCGLRVSEIDWLLWEAFDFKAKKLRIENTQYHRLKSEDSAGELDLSPKTVTIFERFFKSASTQFVIEPSLRKRRRRKEGDGDSSQPRYRAGSHFETLKRWLRKNGVVDKKPIHVLRKECGSELASQLDIFAASRYLRHSDIRITAAFYADKKRTVVPDFAK